MATNKRTAKQLATVKRDAVKLENDAKTLKKAASHRKSAAKPRAAKGPVAKVVTVAAKKVAKIKEWEKKQVAHVKKLAAKEIAIVQKAVKKTEKEVKALAKKGVITPAEFRTLTGSHVEKAGITNPAMIAGMLDPQVKKDCAVVANSPAFTAGEKIAIIGKATGDHSHRMLGYFQRGGRKG